MPRHRFRGFLKAWSKHRGSQKTKLIVRPKVGESWTFIDGSCSKTAPLSAKVEGVGAAEKAGGSGAIKAMDNAGTVTTFLDSAAHTAGALYAAYKHGSKKTTEEILAKYNPVDKQKEENTKNISALVSMNELALENLNEIKAELARLECSKKAAARTRIIRTGGNGPKNGGDDEVDDASDEVVAAESEKGDDAAGDGGEKTQAAVSEPKGEKPIESANGEMETEDDEDYEY